MAIPIELQLLRDAEACANRGDDMEHGWNEEGSLFYRDIQQRLAWSRRAVAIHERTLARFGQFAPAQPGGSQAAVQGQGPAPAARIAPVKNAQGS
jgi:hypothetical protein